MPAERRGPMCGESNIDLCQTPGTLGIRDAWDVSCPNVIVRHGGAGGAITRAEGGEIVLAHAGKSPLRGTRHKTKTRVYRELNIVGSFPFEGRPWKNVAEILSAMKRDRWFPADKELRIFANSKRPKKNSMYVVAPDVNGFIRALYLYPAKRINLFTHGTMLSGTVIKGNVIYNAGNQYDLLGPWYYTAIDPNFRFKAKRSWLTIQSLRRIMPRGAKLIIYGCKSGSKRGDLRRLSRLLGVVVEGFRHSILYHAVMSKTGSKIVGWRYSHGKTGKPVDDYHKLNPDVSSN